MILHDIEVRISFVDEGKLISQLVDLRVEDFEAQTIEQAAQDWCDNYCEPDSYRGFYVDWSRWDV